MDQGDQMDTKVLANDSENSNLPNKMEDTKQSGECNDTDKQDSPKCDNKENVSEIIVSSDSADQIEKSDIENQEKVDTDGDSEIVNTNDDGNIKNNSNPTNTEEESAVTEPQEKNQPDEESTDIQETEEKMETNEESDEINDSTTSTEDKSGKDKKTRKISDDKDKSFDSPSRMPGRGKKRGRTSDVTPESPEAKKRAKETKSGKVSHPTHPDFNKTGVVLTLGEGDVGQLGLGEDIIERSRPALLKLDDPFVQACAGGMHTACLTKEGKMYTFGCNDEAALGRDTSEEGSETLPARLDLPYKIIQITCGDSHTAILTEDGHVYAWGNFRDANGSMGLTARGISTEPLEMLPGETVVKIASGGDHLVCLTDKGEIFTGGCAEQGQLGRVAECFAGRGGRKGLDSILKMGPVRCKKHGSRKKATWSDIWAGQYVTFAKEEETGEIYSWGLNNYYQLGFEDMQNRFVPEWVSSFAKHNEKWVKVQAGQHHTMLLDEAGKVYTLGRAEYGRLGIGENPGERSDPTLVGKLPGKCVDIAAGQSVSLALMEDGTVYGWGMGTSKQLGTGDEEDVWEPVQMNGKQLENRFVFGVSAGGQHTVLLARDKS